MNKKLMFHRLKPVLLILLVIAVTVAIYIFFNAKAKIEKTQTSGNNQQNTADQTKGLNNSSGISLAKAEKNSSVPVPADPYPVHKNISTTYFWVGEPADGDNGHISNSPSAWDDDWEKHFGGVDDPKKRNGYLPAKFVPKENPFYAALPYNDFDSNGKRRSDAGKTIYWSGGQKWGSLQSECKNQWVKITKGGKTAYAQWEDVGPFGENDAAYVFGSAAPKNKTNNHAGLDVSPAVHDFLGLSDVDKTSWQFVPAEDVPDGPWKQIATASQIFWN